MSKVYKAALVVNSETPYVLNIPMENGPSVFDEGLLSLELEGENPQVIQNAHAQLDGMIKRSTDQAEEIINSANYKAQKIIDEANDQLSIAMHARDAAEEASQNAAAKIFEAQGQADEIMASAQIEAQTIKSTAYEEGYSEGLRRARDEVVSANAEVFEALQEAVLRLDHEKGRLFSSYEDELIKIAAAIAKKVVQMELATAEDSFIYILTQAAKQFRNSKRMTLTIKEGQLSADLIGDADFLKVVFAGIEHVEIIEKNNVPDGYAIMDNGETIVDASLDTQIDLIEKELLS